MPAIAALTLADGQTTPVNHTFSPLGTSLGIAKWVDRVAGIAIGFPQITMSIKEPSTKGSQNYKVVRKVVLPVLDISSPSTSTGIQPAPSRAYELINVSEWTLPARSTNQQRADLLAFCKNFDANIIFTDAVKNFEPVW